MDSLVFHVEADKLDTNVLDSIKAFFGHRRISISVQPEKNLSVLSEDEFRAKIESGENADYEYRLSPDALKDYIHQAIAGEPDDSLMFKHSLESTAKQPA